MQESNVLSRLEEDSKRRKDRMVRVSHQTLATNIMGDGVVFERLIQDKNRRSQKQLKIEAYKKQQEEPQEVKTNPRIMSRVESASLFSRLHQAKSTKEEKVMVKPQERISQSSESQLITRLNKSKSNSILKRERAKQIQEDKEAEKYQKIRDLNHPRRSEVVDMSRIASKVSYRAERISRRLFGHKSIQNKS